jgi:hypothetical protein
VPVVGWLDTTKNMKVPSAAAATAIHATLCLLPRQEEPATVAAALHPRDCSEWPTAGRHRRHEIQGHVASLCYCCQTDRCQPRRRRRRTGSSRYSNTTVSRDKNGVVWSVPRGGGGGMGLLLSSSSSAVHTVYQTVWRRATVAQCVAVYWMIQGWRSSIDSVRFWRRNGDLQLSVDHQLAAWAGGVIGYV